MNTQTERKKCRLPQFMKAARAVIALSVTVGGLCPPLLGQGTLAVIQQTYVLGSPPCFLSQVGLSFGVWETPLFIGVVVSTNAVGRMFPVTQAQDTNFNAIVAVLTNGISDMVECDCMLLTCSGGGTAAYERTLFSPLPPNGNGVDFRGFHIDNIAFQIDSLSSSADPGGRTTIISFRIFVNSQPVPGPAPDVIWQPTTQTTELGSSVNFSVGVTNEPPPVCLWFFNATNILSFSTNLNLALTNVQFSQSGAYTAVLNNGFGSTTSAPAILSVIPRAERRPVPGIVLRGAAGDTLTVDYADTLGLTSYWTTLGSASLVSTSRYYFDLTVPLPPRRFYRASQTTPGQPPTVDLHMVPAITLTGAPGSSVRLDYINQFGPTDAWVTLATITLTNTSQLYFDTSMIGQPPRLYRLVPQP